MEGEVVVVRLYGGVDRCGHRLRRTGDVACEHDRRAKLAERTRERQHESRNNAVLGIRYEDAPENAPLGDAERACRIDDVLVELLEDAARRAVHEGQ